MEPDATMKGTEESAQLAVLVGEVPDLLHRLRELEATLKMHEVNITNLKNKLADHAEDLATAHKKLSDSQLSARDVSERVRKSEESTTAVRSTLKDHIGNYSIWTSNVADRVAQLEKRLSPVVLDEMFKRQTRAMFYRLYTEQGSGIGAAAKMIAAQYYDSLRES